MSTGNSEFKQIDESFFGTIFSIAAPLIQLIAVTSVALSEQLNFSSLLENNELLPLANLSVILITLSSIAILSLRQNNILLSFMKKGNGTLSFLTRLKLVFSPKDPYPDPSMPDYSDERQQQIKGLNKVFVLFQIPSLIIFFISILTTFDFFGQRPIVQYFSYITFLSSSGLISFMWFQDFQKQRKNTKPEKIFPNIVDAMRASGLLKEKNVVPIRRISQNNTAEILFKVNIEQKGNYILLSNYTGTVINGCWKEKEAPERYSSQFNEPQDKTIVSSVLS